MKCDFLYCSALPLQKKNNISSQSGENTILDSFWFFYLSKKKIKKIADSPLSGRAPINTPHTPLSRGKISVKPWINSDWAHDSV